MSEEPESEILALQESAVKALTAGVKPGFVNLKDSTLRRVARAAFNAGVHAAAKHPEAAAKAVSQFDADPMTFLKDDQP